MKYLFMNPEIKSGERTDYSDMPTALLLSGWQRLKADIAADRLPSSGEQYTATAEVVYDSVRELLRRKLPL